MYTVKYKIRNNELILGRAEDSRLERMYLALFLLLK